MQDWLIGAGRALVGWCAAVVVVGGAFAGFLAGGMLDAAFYGGGLGATFVNVDALTVTPGRLIGCVLGAGVGLVVAAATLGLAAAVFDIQRTLRLIAQENPDALNRRPLGDMPRATRRRAEPQLDAPA